MNKASKKPLGVKNYGSIPHLPGSRLGSGDHHCEVGQANIATVKTRDKNDEVIVQEKLDGSNVGIAKVNGEILALGRSGYLASSSPYEQHHLFAEWVEGIDYVFKEVLTEGERLVGEWMALAHGTKYKFDIEPFVAFDIMRGSERLPYDAFFSRTRFAFQSAKILHRGEAFSIDDAVKALGKHGFHGALETPEGAIWRVERNRPTGERGQKKRVVDFLVKYVRPDKVDGKYFPSISGESEVWNWKPFKKLA